MSPHLALNWLHHLVPETWSGVMEDIVERAKILE